MAESDRERELREEWTRLEAATTDGELSADDIASKMKRKSEVRGEMERLGISPAPDTHQVTTYLRPS